METATETQTPIVNEKDKAAMDHSAMMDQLRMAMDRLETTVNGLPSTNAAILFCGAIENVMGQFKEIFLKNLYEELIRAGVSSSQSKKRLVQIDAASQSLLSAKYTQPQ